MANTAKLKEILEQYTAPAAAELTASHPSGKIRCLACAHRCLIGAGMSGVCKVRFHDGQTLRVPHGYVAGLNVDPIEKKPFFHLLPGSDALSFGMLGCNFRCSYCQNWLTSQTLRDPAAMAPIRQISAEELIALAHRHGAQVVTSTYNEPLITTEWAAEVFRLAKTRGLKCTYVSNGFATPEVLSYLAPTLDGMKVDLKSMREENYRRLGGRLEPVLETIRLLHEKRIWVEVVTLLVPGFNDSPDELREIVRFLVSISPDIPWHVTAFHPDYQMTDTPPTTARQLLAAANLAREEGLRYVYAGNLPGRVGDFENTRCPQCKTVLVRRYGFTVLENQLGESGSCPNCGFEIAGIWA
ncbi:MAG: AmmeMemoRadiSam system radical SAM enzyme [Candidatus Sumerlaea chitinivorans]|jgi:pyruvate formate lyase activating enzyme|nr:AmmeMemoRadiSam system radical SAM enzyme [Candidatus Sumerlaea chitinivorans]